MLDANTRQNKLQRPQNPALDGAVFPVEVGDFVLGDPAVWLAPLRPAVINPRRRSRRRTWPDALAPLYFAELARQKQEPVIIPDELFACCAWGAGSRPRGWKSQVRRRISDTLEQRTGRPSHEICNPRCPYYASGIRHAHHHWTAPLEGGLGSLESFVVGTKPTRFNFDAVDQKGRPLKNVLRKQLYEAYLPIELFGPSPRINIPYRQRRLLQALVRETSRIPKRRKDGHPGQDRTAWVEGGHVLPAKGKATIGCPYLDPRNRYVNFGGNFKSNAGRGYTIIGRTRGGWLRRAGYPLTADTSIEQTCDWVGLMLRDLRVLAADFNLTVAGLVGTEWRSLDRMIAMLDTQAGRRWLESCRLRIFAPADYLTIWRRWFASKMGYSYIPGGTWEQPTSVAGMPTRLEPDEVKRWMREHGMTQTQLAQALGITQAMVSYHLRGEKSWSNDVQTRMETLVRRSRVQI